MHFLRLICIAQAALIATLLLQGCGVIVRRVSIDRAANQDADLQWDRLISACNSAIHTRFGGKLQPEFAMQPLRSVSTRGRVATSNNEDERIAWKHMKHSGYCFRAANGNNIVIQTFHKRTGAPTS